MGYLHFYSKTILCILRRVLGSRPLWGIYISIQKMDTNITLEMTNVLVPYGLSTFLFKEIGKLLYITDTFSSPMGYLHFYSNANLSNIIIDCVLVPYGVSTFLFDENIILYSKNKRFSSPMGYLHFYSQGNVIRYGDLQKCSRPLWGIYISIHKIILNT